jgi:hypothetical protein
LRFKYRGPERVGKEPLISTETIPAGKTHVYEDFLREIAASGTVRVECSPEVDVYARIQDSLDTGTTFRAGRLYRPFRFDDAIGAGGKRKLRASADLIIAEVAGKSVRVDVVATNAEGLIYGKTTLGVPPYSQRPVSLDNPEHEEFRARTMWSLSNAFTSAFKSLDPVPQLRATAKLAPFLAELNRQN